jgi:hypothetical protein
MGNSKSKRQNTLSLQKELKTGKSIDAVLAMHPNLPDMKFTNSKFNFLEYLVYVHNNEILFQTQQFGSLS